MARVQSPQVTPNDVPRGRGGVSRRRLGAGSLAFLAGLTVAGVGARPASAEGTAAGTGATAAGSGATAAGSVPGGGAGVMGRAGGPLPGAATVRLLAFGDSITVGGSGWGHLGALRETSWLAHLSDRCRVIGAYAKSGATAQLLEAAPAPAAAADLALFAFGTNDLHRGRSVQQMLDGVGKYVSRHFAALAGSTVAVAGVGPRTGADDAALRSWNERVRTEAAARGWLFVDPWSALRGTDAARWADPALTKDGLHPTELGARLLGAGYEREIAWAVAQGTVGAE